MSSFAPFDDARTLLKAAALVPAENIAWPNEPFDEPSRDPAAVWLSVECTGRTLDPIEMNAGGGVWQEEGTFYVHVLVPENEGTDAARVMAKQIASLYRSLGPRASGVVYRRASIGNGIAADPTGLWWPLTVAVDWIYQDINT